MDNMPSLADIAAVTDGKTDGFNGGFWIFALIILFAMMGGGLAAGTARANLDSMPPLRLSRKFSSVSTSARSMTA